MAVRNAAFTTLLNSHAYPVTSLHFCEMQAKRGTEKRVRLFAVMDVPDAPLMDMSQDKAGELGTVFTRPPDPGLNGEDPKYAGVLIFDTSVASSGPGGSSELIAAPRQSVRVLDERPDVMAYSFRLSPRTRTCYMHHDKAQRYAPVGTLHGQVLHRYGDATLDYAYWCDISSSMFRQSDLARMVQANKFYNPTTLEHYVWLWGRTDEGRPLLKRRPLLASAPDVSCAFSAPVNIVQSTAAGNRGGARRDYSGAALLEAYRAGKRIRIEPFQGMRPEAVHVEVDLRFR